MTAPAPAGHWGAVAMSYDEAYGQAPTPEAASARRTPVWMRGLTIGGVAAVIVTANAVAMAHLVDRYRITLPIRAEQQRLSAERAAAAEAALWEEREKRREAEAADAPPASLDVTVQSPSPPTRTDRPGRTVEQPLRWANQPNYVVRVEQLGGNFDRVSAQFTCVSQADGRLTGCSGVDVPAGSGLAAILLPQLKDARVEPLLVNGRPGAGRIQFRVSYTITRSHQPAPPRPVVAEDGAYAPRAPRPAPSQLDQPSAAGPINLETPGLRIPNAAPTPSPAGDDLAEER